MAGSPLMLNQFLGLLPAKYWKVAKLQFAYVVEFLPATLSVVTTANLQISSDSDFALYYMTATVFDVTNATQNSTPSFLVDIKDQGSGRFWNSAPVQIQNWFGNYNTLGGAGPFIYIKPQILGGGSTLTIAVTNNTATSFNIRMAFHGLKLFVGTGED